MLGESTRDFHSKQLAKLLGFQLVRDQNTFPVKWWKLSFPYLSCPNYNQDKPNAGPCMSKTIDWTTRVKQPDSTCACSVVQLLSFHITCLPLSLQCQQKSIWGSVYSNTPYIMLTRAKIANMVLITMLRNWLEPSSTSIFVYLGWVIRFGVEGWSPRG